MLQGASRARVRMGAENDRRRKRRRTNGSGGGETLARWRRTKDKCEMPSCVEGMNLQYHYRRVCGRA